MKKNKPKSFVKIFPFEESVEFMRSMSDTLRDVENMREKAKSLFDCANTIMKELDRPEVLLFSRISSFGMVVNNSENDFIMRDRKILYIGDLIIRTKNDLRKLGLNSEEIEEELKKLDLRLGMTKTSIKSWISHKNREKKASPEKVKLTKAEKLLSKTIEATKEAIQKQEETFKKRQKVYEEIEFGGKHRSFGW